MNNWKYRYCPYCSHEMRPVWFKEKEYLDNWIPTGRSYWVGNYLLCDACRYTEIIDGTFDEAY